MAGQNEVWLYRNGIADFRRVYAVKGKEKVSIPVRRDQVGDLLASIDYFGGVKLTKPPSYSPEDNKSSLTIDPTDPLGSALKAFSGAQVKLTLKGTYANANTAEGVLAGVEVVDESTANGTIVPKKYVGIYTAEGFQQFSVRDDIKSVQFSNDADRAEFNKALARNYQKIKPESTFIDLILEATNGQAEATLQYALPVAAWNMSYRLKRDKANRWMLDGHAVVHNSTDFDWNGFRVSVVTGEPTSFTHDLAEAKVPSRSRVNVTPERAYSNVSVEEGTQYNEAYGGGGRAKTASRGVAMRAMAAPQMASYSGHSASFGGMEAAMDYADAELEAVGAAAVDLADASTVGDYLVLTANNVADIPANNSALVPMFSKELPEAERVFYYKPANNPSFPFSAVKFKNTTEMPLTKGVVTVTIEGHNAGEAVLEEAKPGDTRLLAHSLESGIRITKDQAKTDNPIALVKIGEGAVYTETRSIATQEYTIKNKLDEEATLLIEHPWNVPQAEVEASLDGVTITGFEKISTGVRFTVKVPAKQTVNLLVKENLLTKNSVALNQNQFVWVRNQGWFDNDRAFKEVATIQEEIDRLAQEQRDATAERQKHLETQTRANGFLPNAEGQAKQRWSDAITTAEDAIQKIDSDTLPTISKKQKEAQQRLQDALKALQAQWQPGKAKQVA